MALTLADVSRIAHLARLELSSADAAPMLEQLNGFFGIVEQMRDVVTEVDRREANQRSAPAVENGLFLVPKVIE